MTATRPSLRTASACSTKSSSRSKAWSPSTIGALASPRAVTWRAVCHQWFCAGARARSVFPTICVHMWSVSRVPCQGASGSSGQRCVASSGAMRILPPERGCAGSPFLVVSGDGGNAVHERALARPSGPPLLDEAVDAPGHHRVKDAQEHVEDVVVVEVDGGEGDEREEREARGAEPALPQLEPEEEGEERVRDVERGDGAEDVRAPPVEGGEVRDAGELVPARCAGGRGVDGEVRRTEAVVGHVPGRRGPVDEDDVGGAGDEVDERPVVPPEVLVRREHRAALANPE